MPATAAQSRAPLVSGRSGPYLLAGALGFLSGGLAARAYYDDLLRPLAHTFGLWITAVTLVVAGQRLRRAVGAAWLCLAVAVLTFYVGLKVRYGVEYPGGSYALNFEVITLWLGLAAVAGSVLALALRWAGRSGVPGAAGSAAALGLLAADAYRRSSNYPGDARVVLTAAVLEAVVIVLATVRTARQLGVVALVTVPAAAIGLAVVSLPDLIEQGFLIP